MCLSNEMLYSSQMDVFALTRKLIDIESTTGMETAVGETLAGELTQLGYDVERMAVEGDRFNVWATHPGHPNPELVLSTHMDTVPPFIPSSETDDRIYGRGSCDAKGIIAAQIAAAEKLKSADASCWPAVSGRRGARQPGCSGCQSAAARSEVPYQRRAYGK